MPPRTAQLDVECMDCALPMVAPTRHKRRCEECRLTNARRACKDWYARTYVRGSGMHRSKFLRNKYGITEADFDRMLEEQNGVCAICGGTEWGGSGSFPHIDHCHDTGVVRGLLCQACNLMLGNAKDDIETLARGIEYLKAGARVEVWV